MTSDMVFEGDVQVHLYGKDALIPIYLHDQVLASLIGVESSELTVNEHRFETIQAVKTFSSDCYPEGFLKAFNKPAWAEIYYDPEKDSMEIDLYETSGGLEMPILWMGTLENNLMPGYEVQWEIFKPVDENKTAFCALVKTQPVPVAN